MSALVDATIGQSDAPHFLAGIRLSRRRGGSIGMRFVPVVVAHANILRRAVTGGVLGAPDAVQDARHGGRQLTPRLVWKRANHDGGSR
jgi:hypothetical protein